MQSNGMLMIFFYSIVVFLLFGDGGTIVIPFFVPTSTFPLGGTGTKCPPRAIGIILEEDDSSCSIDDVGISGDNFVHGTLGSNWS
jgi:hypothetical protein